MLKFLEHTMGRLSHFLLLVGGGAIVLMCVHIVADIIGKFVFNTPVVGTIELVSDYYMIAAVFLPLAYTQHIRGHVTVELFTYNLGPRTIGAFDSVVCLICALATLIFTWHTTVASLEKTAANESLKLAFNTIPLWPARWLLPISALILALVLILQSVRGLVQAVTGQVPLGEHEHFGRKSLKANRGK